MNTIAEIEARIDALNREVIQLKIARNALTPFGRLPDDVLIDIARFTGNSPSSITREMFVLTFVCSRLRSALLDAPWLWTKVDVCRGEAWMDRCLAHAGSRLLQVTVNLFNYRPERQISRDRAIESVVENLYRCTFLKVEVDQERDEKFVSRIKSLASASTSTLKTLVISGLSFEPELTDKADAFLPLKSFTSLSTLRITRVAVESLPHLPNLSQVKLDTIACPIRSLYGFLSCSPMLESVTFSTIVDWKSLEDDPLQSHTRINLPKLQHLEVQEDLWALGELVRVLPYPSTTLNIFVDQPYEAVNDWSGSELEQAVLNWVLQSPQARPTGFSNGTCEIKCMSSGDGNAGWLWVTLWSGVQNDPTLSFKFACTIKTGGPIFEDVRVLNMDCDGDVEDGLDHFLRDLDLSCLPQVEELNIVSANWRADTDIKVLEDWIISRKQQGHPLRTIHFSKCDDGVRALLFRLQAQQLASTITWNKSE